MLHDFVGFAHISLCFVANADARPPHATLSILCYTNYIIFLRFHFWGYLGVYVQEGAL